VPVPPARPLFLPEGLPWQIGTDEFDDLIQRSIGWNLGVTYLPGARPLHASELAALPTIFWLGSPRQIGCCKMSIEAPATRTCSPTTRLLGHRLWVVPVREPDCLGHGPVPLRLSG
jgi:hypothetical protein